MDTKKVLMSGFIALGLFGCSKPEPQVIDIDEAAANVGLAPDDYEVHENGAIEIKSKMDYKSEIGTDSPLATHGDNWQYVISNALLVADAHAVENNPSATYIPQNSDISLIEQMGGQYEGEHLLTVVNDNNGDISYVQLRPLFDIDESSDLLEERLTDETPLWEVTIAKYNGKEF